MPLMADRNLLLGILALQTDFINRGDLIAAMLAWSVAKDRSLEDILVDQGALDPADRDLLRPMVDRHVAKHGGPEASLAAIGSANPIMDDLMRAGPNPDVIASLGHAPLSLGRRSGDPDARPRQAAPPFVRHSEKPASILIRRPSGGNGPAGLDLPHPILESLSEVDDSEKSTALETTI
jgi:hypothetical protein